MEASAHQELMGSPGEAQLKLHTGLFFAESEFICLKLQKSQQKSNFTQVPHCCPALLRAASAQDVLQCPSLSIIPVLWPGQSIPVPCKLQLLP